MCILRNNSLPASKFDFIRHSFKPQPFNRSFYEMESILVENPLVNEYNASLTGSQIVASYETCSRLPISPNESYSLFNNFEMSSPNLKNLFCEIEMPFLNIDPSNVANSLIPFSSAHTYCIASNERTFALGIGDKLSRARPPYRV